jgi:hypothetical protein
MSRLVFYHGTSKVNAEKIMKEGFKVTDVVHNWDIPSKEGFVSFSLAYAPFYASNCKVDNEDDDMLALIKVDIDERDLYPEDDFIMYVAGKPKYTSEDLSKIDFEKNKILWRASLKHMGNVCAKPNKIRILGVTYFSGRKLIMKCDPVITPMNYLVCGQYYLELTEHIFAGGDIMSFKGMNESIFGVNYKERLTEDVK